MGKRNLQRVRHKDLEEWRELRKTIIMNRPTRKVYKGQWVNDETHEFPEKPYSSIEPIVTQMKGRCVVKQRLNFRYRRSSICSGKYLIFSLPLYS